MFPDLNIELEIKDTTDTYKSASYLDLVLEMTTDGRLNTKIYDKRNDFNFLKVNFPFLCSNIPAAPEYGVYVYQLKHYSRASSKYVDFVERGILLSQKFLRQSYELIKLRSSLKKFYYMAIMS